MLLSKAESLDRALLITIPKICKLPTRQGSRQYFMEKPTPQRLEKGPANSLSEACLNALIFHIFNQILNKLDQNTSQEPRQYVECCFQSCSIQIRWS